MSAGPNILAQVEPHVTAEPATAKEIWQRVDCWSPMTIRHALEKLRKQGVIIGTDEPTATGVVRLYRRSA